MLNRYDDDDDDVTDATAVDNVDILDTAAASVSLVPTHHGRYCSWRRVQFLERESLKENDDVMNN